MRVGNAILPAQVMNKGLAERIAGEPELGLTYLRGIGWLLGVPEDIKGLSESLASDASSWITGTPIPMDGGNLAKNAGGSHRHAGFGPELNKRRLLCISGWKIQCHCFLCKNCETLRWPCWPHSARPTSMPRLCATVWWAPTWPAMIRMACCG